MPKALPRHSVLHPLLSIERRIIFPSDTALRLRTVAEQLSALLGAETANPNRFRVMHPDDIRRRVLTAAQVHAACVNTAISPPPIEHKQVPRILRILPNDYLPGRLGQAQWIADRPRYRLRVPIFSEAADEEQAACLAQLQVRTGARVNPLVRDKTMASIATTGWNPAQETRAEALRLVSEALPDGLPVILDHAQPYAKDNQNLWIPEQPQPHWNSPPGVAGP